LFPEQQREQSGLVVGQLCGQRGGASLNLPAASDLTWIFFCPNFIYLKNPFLFFGPHPFFLISFARLLSPQAHYLKVTLGSILNV